MNEIYVNVIYVNEIYLNVINGCKILANWFLILSVGK